VASNTGSGAGSGSAAPPPPPPPHVPVKLTPELKAITITLGPNWERDVDEGGTFSLEVRRKDLPAKTFTFFYGYDPDNAPADRDAYMKYLADQHLLTVTLNRQRGAAWYLEGTDATGAPAFRYLVIYGGKRLVCGGSLYKDPESSKFGEARDQVIQAAQKTCEGLGL
jgi:hypothetical protein